MPDVSTLAELAWADLTAARQRHPQVVPTECAPVLYFGDAQAYRRSPLRVVTVGLNPSDREFPRSDPWRRFPAAQNRGGYLSALNGYFTTAPLNWFDCFRELLRGLDASFSAGSTNQALHTDICSVVPTCPTWSKLPDQAQQDLAARGLRTWHELVAELRPHVIVASVRYGWLDRIRFDRLGPWQPVHTVVRDNPYLVDGCHLRLPDGSRTFLARGRAANTPFGTISNPDRYTVGRALGRLL